MALKGTREYRIESVPSFDSRTMIASSSQDCHKYRLKVILQTVAGLHCQESNE